MVRVSRSVCDSAVRVTHAPPPYVLVHKENKLDHHCMGRGIREFSLENALAYYGFENPVLGDVAVFRVQE